MTKNKYQIDQFVRIKTGEIKGSVGRITELFRCKPDGMKTRLMYNVDGHINTGTSKVHFNRYFFSHEIEPAENPPALVELKLNEPIIFRDNNKIGLVIASPVEFDRLIAILKEEKSEFIRRRKKAFEDKHQLSLF